MFTPDDLTSLDKAIASSELTVRFGDRMVTYRSIDELLRAREAVQLELSAQNGTRIKRHTRLITNSGW